MTWCGVGAAPRRERLATSAAAGAAPQRRAPGGDAGGPGAPGPARRTCPRLAAGGAPRPARDAAALAPRRVPRRPPREAATVALIRRLAAENPLGGTNAAAANVGSWGGAWPSAPAQLPCLVRALRARAGRRGPPPCASTPRISGRATSCRSPIAASGPWSAAASARSVRGASYLSVSPATRRTPGSHRDSASPGHSTSARATSSSTTTARMGRNSTAWRTRAGSAYCARLRAPRANAVCERFLGSVRRKGLDHLLVLGERHLARVLREYVASFNRAGPQQGRGQARPANRQRTSRGATPARYVGYRSWVACTIPTTTPHKAVRTHFQPSQLVIPPQSESGRSTTTFALLHCSGYCSIS